MQISIHKRPHVCMSTKGEFIAMHSRNRSRHNGESQRKKQKVTFNYDEEITSEEDEDIFDSKRGEEEEDSSDEEEEAETANEKRIRYVLTPLKLF